MPKGIPKNGINKGWFKKGNRSPKFLGFTKLICPFCDKPFKKITSYCNYCRKKNPDTRFFCSSKCRNDDFRATLPENRPNWKGGKIIRKSGGRKSYYYIHKPNHPFVGKQGYIAEHRLVMEKKLGRYLLSKEVVHHIDGKTLNNNPENLRVFKNNGEHIAIGHPEIAEAIKELFKGKHFSPATEFKKSF